MVTDRLARGLGLPVADRLRRRIEVNRQRGRGGDRLLLDVYLVPHFEPLPDTSLYHALLAGQGVSLLRPDAWEIPPYGNLLEPDAYMVFPWGVGYLEVDTGHYSKEVVREKLRSFRRRADRLYWASPNRSRLLWAQELAQAWQTPLVPLWLPPLV